MNFPLWYSVVFGGIFALTLIGMNYFVPLIATQVSLFIWIFGLAVYYLVRDYTIKEIKRKENLKWE